MRKTAKQRKNAIIQRDKYRKKRLDYYIRGMKLNFRDESNKAFLDLVLPINKRQAPNRRTLKLARSLHKERLQQEKRAKIYQKTVTTRYSTIFKKKPTLLTTNERILKSNLITHINLQFNKLKGKLRFYAKKYQQKFAKFYGIETEKVPQKILIPPHKTVSIKDFDFLGWVLSGFDNRGNWSNETPISDKEKRRLYEIYEYIRRTGGSYENYRKDRKAGAYFPITTFEKKK